MLSRIQLLSVVALAFVVSPVLAQEKPAAIPGLTTPQQKASYAIGLNIGRSIKGQGLTAENVDVQALTRAISDALSGREPAMSREEIQAAFSGLQKMIQENAAKAGEKNLETGRKFLAANAKKAGVKTTKSGLQYTVIKAGNGATPTKADTVTTHYKGRLINGTVFDGSYKGEAPAAGDQTISFPVGGVIAGWTEALQLMKVGAHWQLFIPSELAYKERGAGGDIGPNETLIFDIHLIGIK